jgi:putative transposase
MVSPASKRRVVSYILREYEAVAAISERWACKLVDLNRSTFRYEPCPERLDEQFAFVAAVREVCGRKHCRRYGYRRITEVLNAEGWHVNAKRTRRVMREEGLMRKPKRRRRRAKGLSANSCSLLKPREVNDVWTYDFIKVRLADGTALRQLNVVDEFSRFAMPPLIQRSITAEDVIDHFARLIPIYGAPRLLRSDNGPEFVANELTAWMGRMQIGCRFVAPASPWENAYVETFHDKLRDELLNLELLITADEARVVISDWIDHYNHDRRHTGLHGRTPAQARFPAESPKLPEGGAVATTSSTTTENSHKGGPT